MKPKTKKNDRLLDGETIAAALREVGLDDSGTLVEKADRLEAHYIALPEPVGWSSKPANKGGGGAWHLECMTSKKGCGRMTTAQQDYCVFCGDGLDEVKKKSAMVLRGHIPEPLEAEFDDDRGLHQKVTLAGVVDGTVEDLEEAVRQVGERRRVLAAGERDTTGREWDLGVSIFDIFRRNLCFARKKEGGAPVYPSWGAFCRAELQMSSATANRYMRIAVNFNRELACDLGPSKLVELLPAAEAQAAEEVVAARLGRAVKPLLPPLIERARVLPVNELRSEVKAAVPALSRHGGRTGKATEAAAAKKLSAKKPEAERITVQRQEGTVKIRFFTNEQAAREGDRGKLAKKFAEGVVAIEHAVNGVEVICTLRIDGKLGLVLHRRIARVAE